MNPVCPYCRTEISDTDGGRIECSACHTPHHEDCFAENGGCTVFGCPQAPADEPKISLTGAELASPQSVTASGPGTSPAVTTISLPPPPPASAADTTAVAPPPPPLGYSSGPSQASGLATSNAPRLTAGEIYAGVEAHKNRVIYVLLGLFLGMFGVHSFYARYYRRGAAQAALSVFSWWLFSQGYGMLISWIWAVLEICLISKDADGVQFS